MAEFKMQSPLLYIDKDDRQGFIHDTYQDFFLADYLAREINFKKRPVDDVLTDDVLGEEKISQPCLEFLASKLKKPKLKQLMQKLSHNYFKDKEEDFDFYHEDFSFVEETESSDLHLDELNLVYGIAYGLDMPLAELPSSLQKEIHYLVFHDYFWQLDGKAQSFLFRNLPTGKKKELTDKILESPYFREEEGLDHRPDSCFKFDLEGTGLILKYLSSTPESDYSNAQWGYQDGGGVMLPPERLAKHLEGSKEVFSLWLDYLNRDELNLPYAAEVLISLGKSQQVIDPLSELLKSPYGCHDPHDFDEIAYKREVMKIMVEACIQAMPVKEEILRPVESEEKSYPLKILENMAGKGSHKASYVLEKFQAAVENIRKDIAEGNLECSLDELIEEFWADCADLDEDEEMKAEFEDELEEF